MSVNGIGQSQQPQQNQAMGGITEAYGDVVSQDQFFQLLIAQLKNQDPLNPTENAEFVAELAQFTSLEQQTNQTKLLEQLVNNENSGVVDQSLSMIGKDVTVSNEPVNFVPGDEMRYLFHTEGPANVMVQVTNAAGQVVHTENVSVSEAGQHEYVFDGQLDNGMSLIAGEYKVSFGNSLSSDGSESEYNSFMLGRVNGVNFLGGSPVLMVNGQSLTMDKVMAVYESFDGEGTQG